MAKPKTIKFGKHAGKRFTEIPLEYLQWLVNLPNNGRRRAFPERTYARKEIVRRNQEFIKKNITSTSMN